MDEAPKPHRRRPRYRGTHPRRFEEKYKERDPGRFAETVAKVRASGKTPAGQHVPILVKEILEVLKLRSGSRVVDATLGYGGHTRALLKAIKPDGLVLGLDRDPVELAKTEQRLRGEGWDESSFVARRTNYAGLLKAMGEVSWDAGADAVLADLGVSSMQIDDPGRGFSFKLEGPLDMRMNPRQGASAREWLQQVSEEKLTVALTENADEPQAATLARALAGSEIASTAELAAAVRTAVPHYLEPEDVELTVRRVFQAVRIAVNDEFSALDAFLGQLPFGLRPGARAAVLTFHSGEDRRVKKAFRAGFDAGIYSEISDEVIRAGAAELRDNPRSSSAKLRWALRA